MTLVIKRLQQLLQSPDALDTHDIKKIERLIFKDGFASLEELSVLKNKDSETTFTTANLKERYQLLIDDNQFLTHKSYYIKLAEAGQSLPHKIKRPNFDTAEGLSSDIVNAIIEEYPVLRDDQNIPPLFYSLNGESNTGWQKNTIETAFRAFPDNLATMLVTYETKILLENDVSKVNRISDLYSFHKTPLAGFYINRNDFPLVVSFNFSDTLCHEIGHAVMSIIANDYGGFENSLVRETIFKHYQAQMNSNSKLPRNSLGTMPSLYSRKNDNEWFAEYFATFNYVRGNSLPRQSPYVRYLESQLKEDPVAYLLFDRMYQVFETEGYAHVADVFSPDFYQVALDFAKQNPTLDEATLVKWRDYSVATETLKHLRDGHDVFNDLIQQYPALKVLTASKTSRELWEDMWDDSTENSVLEAGTVSSDPAYNWGTLFTEIAQYMQTGASQSLLFSLTKLVDGLMQNAISNVWPSLSQYLETPAGLGKLQEIKPRLFTIQKYSSPHNNIDMVLTIAFIKNGQMDKANKLSIELNYYNENILKVAEAFYKADSSENAYVLEKKYFEGQGKRYEAGIAVLKQMITMKRYQDCLRFKDEYKNEETWLAVITDALTLVDVKMDGENPDWKMLEDKMNELRQP